MQQVTAQWVKDAVNNTPFVLLTSNDKSHWNQYSVTQNADTFVLKPKAKNSNIKQFDIRVDANGVLKISARQKRWSNQSLCIAQYYKPNLS